MCLAGRMYTLPPDYQRLFLDQFEEVFDRFSAAFKRVLPHLSDRSRLWRFFFVVGTMVMTLAGADLIAYRSKGLIDASDADQTIDQIMAFLTAGFLAPDPEPPTG